MFDSAILICDNNLDVMCVFMASAGIFCSSASACSVPGLQTKLRDGPLHIEKARSFRPDPFAGEPVTVVAGMLVVAETDKCVDKATTRCKPGKS